MLALNPYSEIAFFRKNPSILIIVIKSLAHFRRALNGFADPLQLTSFPCTECYHELMWVRENVLEYLKTLRWEQN